MQIPRDDQLMVPVGRVRSSRRYGAVLAAGAAIAITAVGVLGGGGPDRPGPLGSPRPTGAHAGPTLSVAIIDPARGAILDTGRVRVSGTASRGTPALEVRILVDGIIVGRTVVVPRGGGFAAEVALLAPYGGDPVAARLIVSPVGRPADRLAQREVTVRPASVVAIEEVSLRRGGDASVVVIRGTASLDVRRVRVEVERGSEGASGEATVGYRNDADFTEAVLGFGAGEWTVTVPVSFPAGPARVTASWDGRRAEGQTVLEVDLRG